jgi:predicted dienelactone hydrolase
MTIMWRLELLCLLAVVLNASPAASQALNGAEFKVGVSSRHVLPPGSYDWRGAGSHALLEAVWYPTEDAAQPVPQQFGPPGQPVFEAGPAATNAKIAQRPDKFPLIMLSHGTGGTAQSVAWLATGLAARGYIVAAINHPGNHARAPYTVQGFILWWLRALDLRTALDNILTDDEFGPRIDPQRIGAAGFSLGGYTVIELAGGITSRRLLDEFCAEPANQTSCKLPPEFPDLLAKAKALAESDPAFAEALRGESASYRDPRIRAAFAIAPAIGPAVTPTSLAAITIPVAIVAGAADGLAPVDANAKYYAERIPHAELTIFPGVDHYTFLDECTPSGRSIITSLCTDPPGVDRRQVHDATVALAAIFFGAHF